MHIFNVVGKVRFVLYSQKFTVNSLDSRDIKRISIQAKFYVWYFSIKIITYKWLLIPSVHE